jgi:hypothetical protein
MEADAFAGGPTQKRKQVTTIVLKNVDLALSRIL